MEKLTKKEYEILELIRHGKSKSSIIMELKTMPNIINQYFSSIYKKTDFLVCYHSAKNKFEELQGFLRNNPTAFTVATNESNQIDLLKIKNLESQNENLKKEVEKFKNKKSNVVNINGKQEPLFNSILEDLKTKYDMEKYNAHIKLEVLDEIKTKLNQKEQQHAAD